MEIDNTPTLNRVRFEGEKQKQIELIVSPMDPQHHNRNRNNNNHNRLPRVPKENRKDGKKSTDPNNNNTVKDKTKTKPIAEKVEERTLMDLCIECIVSNLKRFQSFEGYLDNGKAFVLIVGIDL